MKLIRYTPFPPGEFPYRQVVDGKVYDFPGVGLDIVSQAKKIAEFRRANGLPRSSPSEALDDLDTYTCQRLGNDPNYCSDGTQTALSRAIPQLQQRGCSGCGAKV